MIFTTQSNEHRPQTPLMGTLLLGPLRAAAVEDGVCHGIDGIHREEDHHGAQDNNRHTTEQLPTEVELRVGLHTQFLIPRYSKSTTDQKGIK